MTVVFLLLAACTRPHVSDELTIDLDKDGATATVTVETTFDSIAKSEAIRARVDDARASATAGLDAWSARFERVRPELLRKSLERRRGELVSVTQSGVMRRDDLQRFFADASLTIDLLDGNGWSELTILPATSMRATREQREHFAEAMTTWSNETARYFNAMHHLYSYLQERPSRARYVFAALLNEKGVDGAPPAVTKDEQPLVDAVNAAMERIADRMDAEERRAHSLAEEADLVFNPFPARMVIRLPGSVIDSRGFTKEGDTFLVEPVDLFATIASLEGRWITPDPLAALIRGGSVPTAAEFARMERRSEPMVGASDVESVLREKLARPATYSVRWRQ